MRRVGQHLPTRLRAPLRAHLWSHLWSRLQSRLRSRLAPPRAVHRAWPLAGAFAAAALMPAAALPQSDSLMGPGVSLALAAYRARTVADVHYQLTLDVTPLDSAVGRVTVRWRHTGPGDAILDFRGQSLVSIEANGRRVDRGAFNGAHIRIPAAMLVEGDNTATFRFTSAIAPAGASIIRARDADGSNYLYTLLVPADANQLFPCFDQPDLKARVTLAVGTPENWTVVANGSLHITERAGPGVIHHFAETHPISTYLIAFAAGPWHRVTATEQGRTMNAYVRASRAQEADLDTLLALNLRALAWMEEYFGIPFPFEKYDFVLAPAFPFGGMEHPGAVFYNENTFIFRERPTPARRLARFSTILHEVAHQWFGDLVTMRWFDDLWLKEGFATYIAAKAQFALDSASGAWKTFHQNNKPSAYAVDQTAGTTPLWQRLGNLDQAKSNYGAIVYNKAPSVLKQLNFLVGEEAFRRGVREFLLRHSYGNATWQDLLSAIGTAGGVTLDEFGWNFLVRAGMPIVEQRLTLEGGRIARLELAQRPAQPVSGEAAWPQRTRVLLVYPDGRSESLPVTLSSALTEVEEARGRPAPRLVFANHDDFGYFVTELDTASIRALEAGALGTTADPLLRTMLWGALWDHVRAATYDPARFVRLALAELPREGDEQLAPNLLGRVVRAVSVYLPDQARDSLLPTVEAALWNAAADPERTFGIRRAHLDAFVALAGTPSGIQRLTALLSADSAAGDAVRDPTRWDVVTRLTVLGHPQAAARRTAQTARDTTPDGRRRAFSAGAAVATAQNKRDYFRRYFADAALNEEWATSSLGAFNAAEHAALTLPFLRPALDSLPFVQANRRIFYLQNWLSAFIGGQRSRQALDIVRAYLDENPSLPPDLRLKVLQTVDELERTVRIRGG